MTIFSIDEKRTRSVISRTWRQNDDA
jgi:hypothetical protein